jgi:hypothetical protein
VYGVVVELHKVPFRHSSSARAVQPYIALSTVPPEAAWIVQRGWVRATTARRAAIPVTTIGKTDGVLCAGTG